MENDMLRHNHVFIEANSLRLGNVAFPHWLLMTAIDAYWSMPSLLKFSILVDFFLYFIFASHSLLNFRQRVS